MSYKDNRDKFTAGLPKLDAYRTHGAKLKWTVHPNTFDLTNTLVGQVQSQWPAQMSYDEWADWDNLQSGDTNSVKSIFAEDVEMHGGASWLTPPSSYVAPTAEWGLVYFVVARPGRYDDIYTWDDSPGPLLCRQNGNTYSPFHLAGNSVDGGAYFDDIVASGKQYIPQKGTFPNLNGSDAPVVLSFVSTYRPRYTTTLLTPTQSSKFAGENDLSGGIAVRFGRLPWSQPRAYGHEAEVGYDPTDPTSDYIFTGGSVTDAYSETGGNSPFRQWGYKTATLAIASIEFPLTSVAERIAFNEWLRSKDSLKIVEHFEKLITPSSQVLHPAGR